MCDTYILGDIDATPRAAALPSPQASHKQHDLMLDSHWHVCHTCVRCCVRGTTIQSQWPKHVAERDAAPLDDWSARVGGRPAERWPGIGVTELYTASPRPFAPSTARHHASFMGTARATRRTVNRRQHRRTSPPVATCWTSFRWAAVARGPTAALAQLGGERSHLRLVLTRPFSPRLRLRSSAFTTARRRVCSARRRAAARR